MSSRFSYTSRFTKIVIIVEFILVGYLLYSLTKNIYNTYQIDKYISTFEEENNSLELENRQKADDYLYFTSEEYIDKIAKQNLGLVNPGEEVIVLSPDVFVEIGDENADNYDSPIYYQELTEPQQWWIFFFGV